MITEDRELIKKIKADIFVIVFFLAAAFLAWLIPQITGNHIQGSEAVVLRDGNEIGRYRLSTDDIITVRGDDGSYNLILISGETVKVTDADCPDKLCVRHKSISRNGESIICLPHKLVVMIDSPEESDLDAVTN